MNTNLKKRIEDYRHNRSGYLGIDACLALSVSRQGDEHREEGGQRDVECPARL